MAKESSMVNPGRYIATTSVFSIALLALMGCSRSPEPSPYPPALTKEQAAQRTVAPLTRPIALDKAGVIADLEFDLPPPGPSSSRQLMLGLRLQNADSRALTQLIEKVAPSDLPAVVRLERLANGQALPVELKYRPDSAGGRYPIGTTGVVPGALPSGVDNNLLREAGLLHDQVLEEFFYFAVLPDAEPGRYRLQLELTRSRDDLSGIGAELVVAYYYRAK